MNLEFALLRIIHIGAGMFWAGGAVFLTFIVVPRLNQLPPAVRRPALGAITEIAGIALAAAGAVTIVAGTYMGLRLRWGHLDTWFDTGWGWAILIGFVVSVAAMGSGGATGVAAQRLVALGASIEGRPPTPEEGAELQALSHRLTMLSRVSSVLVIIAVASMASARFV